MAIEDDQHDVLPFRLCLEELIREKNLSPGAIATVSKNVAKDLAKQDPAKDLKYFDRYKLGATTVREALNGKTGLPREETLEALILAMRLNDAQKVRLNASYKRDRDEKNRRLAEQSRETQPPLTAEGEVGGAGNDKPPTSPAPGFVRRLLRNPVGIVVAVLLIAAVVTSIALIVMQRKDPPTTLTKTNPSSSACLPPPPPPVRTEQSPFDGTWPATVVNTWQSSKCKDAGVLPRNRPVGGEKAKSGYLLGETVGIRCYYLNGDPISDRDTKETTTTWYKISDGQYISAMWLRIHDQPGTRPPDYIPECK